MDLFFIICPFCLWYRKPPKYNSQCKISTKDKLYTFNRCTAEQNNSSQKEATCSFSGKKTHKPISSFFMFIIIAECKRQQLLSEFLKPFLV